jgi:hypothetical protein
MLDRAVQRQILELLEKRYPHGAVPVQELGLDTVMAAKNLRYLEEHGLCEGGIAVGTGDYIQFGQSTITAAGLDFLADDGGLSAILGVVTVRLHADTIKDLIRAKIETSPMLPEEKSKPRKAIDGLSEAGLKEATTGLVKIGLNHLPDAAHWMHFLTQLGGS